MFFNVLAKKRLWLVLFSLPVVLYAQIASVQEEKFLLITGCARSGTAYISEVFRYCGLDIGHELMGTDGCSSWFMCIEADIYPWKGRKTAKNIRFAHTFHQVRNPLDTISSVYATEHPKAIHFFRSNIPEISREDSHLVACAKYWYYWNLHAEAKAEWRYQIEQIDTVFTEMEKRLGIVLDKQSLQRISRKTNHRTYSTKLTWTQLKKALPPDLFFNIQQMALRYGYTIEDL